MQTRYIYKIENLINHKVYIGQTVNYKARKTRHFSELRCHTHCNQYLQSAFDKYGEDNFTFEIIHTEQNCSQQQIDILEIYYIEKYNSFENGYNLNKGGQNCENNGFQTRFTKEQVFNILAMNEFHDSNSGGILARFYETSPTTIYRMSNGFSHLNFKEEYELLSKDEREKIYFDFKKTIKEPLHRMSKARINFPEEMFYLIYIYQEYGNGKRCFIKTDYKIKNSTVIQLIREKKTYKEYWDKYQEFSFEDKIKILCHYMVTYNRKPPELLGNLVTRQSAAKLLEEVERSTTILNGVQSSDWKWEAPNSKEKDEDIVCSL